MLSVHIVKLKVSKKCKIVECRIQAKIITKSSLNLQSKRNTDVKSTKSIAEFSSNFFMKPLFNELF